MFGKLESLRGVAACLVILYHSPFRFGAKPLEFVSNSHLFVDFFFILSGFVMSLAYGEKISKGFPLGTYISLRLGRIYPLHLFMLLTWVPYILIKQYLYASGLGGSDQFETSNLSSFLSNVFLLQSMGLNSYLSWNYPSWSISAEVFAYLMFYLLTRTIDRKNTLYLPLVISTLGYLFLLNLGREAFDITYDFGFLRCWAAFYIGVFLFRLRPRVSIVWSSEWIAVLEVISMVLLIFAVTYAKVSDLGIVLTIASFSIVVAVFSAEKSGYLGRLMETKPMRKLGVWSYSIYMLHAIVLEVLFNIVKYILKIEMHSLLGFVSVLINLLAIAITIFLSRYTYLHIEKKYRDLVRAKVLGHGC